MLFWKRVKYECFKKPVLGVQPNRINRFGWRKAKHFLIILTLGSSCLMSGCTSVRSSIGSLFSGGCLSDAIELHRNRTCALKAWYRREHNFCDQAYLRDFKAGFIDGYVAIAEGKPGCPPIVPPRQYWSWAYQTAEGQAQMAAWYAGYPYGVQAAKDDGFSSWNHVNLGPRFQKNPGQGNWNNQWNQPYSTMGAPGYYPDSGVIPMNTVPMNTVPMNTVPMNSSPSDQQPGSSILQDSNSTSFDSRYFDGSNHSQFPIID